MYGALDVGIYITGSENGARRLRLTFDARDISTPAPIGVELVGDGTGRNGGLTYRDRAWWTESEAPAEDDLTAPAEEIKRWLLEQPEHTAETGHIMSAFSVSERTVERRRGRLDEIGVKWIRGKGGAKGRYVVVAEAAPDPQLALDTTRHDTPDTCRVTPVSGSDPSVQADLEPDTTRSVTGPCRVPETAHLQGLSEPDKPDSSTKSDVPVSGVTSEGREDDIPDPDDDIPA
jgi:hypothetical protein